VGDLPGASRDWHCYWLGPGTVSNGDTDPRFSDADWMTYQQGNFWWRAHQVQEPLRRISGPLTCSIEHTNAKTISQPGGLR